MCVCVARRPFSLRPVVFVCLMKPFLESRGRTPPLHPPSDEETRAEPPKLTQTSSESHRPSRLSRPSTSLLIINAMQSSHRIRVDPRLGGMVHRRVRPLALVDVELQCFSFFFDSLHQRVLYLNFLAFFYNKLLLHFTPVLTLAFFFDVDFLKWFPHFHSSGGHSMWMDSIGVFFNFFLRILIVRSGVACPRPRPLSTRAADWPTETTSFWNTPSPAAATAVSAH